MDDRDDDDAIPPLDSPGVAPFWRIVGIGGLVGAALLFMMVLVLYMSLAAQGARVANNALAMAPPAVAVANAADAADALDPNNPAYPTRQDLRPPGTFPVPGDAEADPEDPQKSPRQEFRALAEREPAWRSNGADVPERVVVSADGTNMAFVGAEGLMVGPVGGPNPVDQDVAVGLPVRRGRGMGGMPMLAPAAAQPGRPHNADARAAVSGWSPDGQVIAWVGENGRPSQHDMRTKGTTQYEFKADALLALSGVDDRQIVVTREPRPKVEGLAGAAGRDLTTVKVLPAPGANQAPTVLAGPEPSRWESPALSPDGRRLAIVSDRGEKPGRWRVWLLSTENREKAEAVTPPAELYEGLCWAPDGKELVYARSTSPAPADHAPGMAKDACDLYALDIGTKQETRLSRGGGFTSPSVTKDGELYFLSRPQPANGAGSVLLLKMPLKAAHEWAEAQEKQRRGRAKDWNELADAALKKAGGATPDAGNLKKIAEAFAAAYKEKFGGEAPATADALDWQRREVAGLDLAPAEQERLRLVLGAVEGEYLIGRQKGSAWHTTKDQAVGPTPLKGENAFGYAYNPFRPLRASEKEDSPQSLAEVLYRAEGRDIVLCNDPAAANEALAKRVDPDRARGSALLQRGNDDEADRVLLALVKRHEGNQYLAVEVGTLLYRHGRTKALAELIKPLRAQLDAGGQGLARDPRLYNLLGVAALEGDPHGAIVAFQDALRCDLNYGPAYLNLADAHEKAGRVADARLCLRRYLKLFPDGEWADDARRRLAVAGDN